ncbi:MAG: hypothetical protein E4H01_06520 [Lysobacterales bacterium]|nr:MAG: hypothetical protein E4H01_06520 [Xanthomonadales bacterium]
MPVLFDPMRTLKAFEEFNLQFLLNRERSRFMPTAVGNAGVQGASEVIFAWLVGLQKEIEPALRKYREWIEDSIARCEQFGDFPAHAKALKHEAHGICIWMMEGRTDEATFQIANQNLEAAWLNEWNKERSTAPAVKLEYVADYLADCIQSGDFGRGVKMYESLIGDTRLDPKKMNSAHEFGYWICLESSKKPPACADVIASGERFLKGNLESVWLGHGQALRAAAWLKIVYWHSGAIESPLQCILKAYDLMPHVKRPDFL